MANEVKANDFWGQLQNTANNVLGLVGAGVGIHTALKGEDKNKTQIQAPQTPVSTPASFNYTPVIIGGVAVVALVAIIVMTKKGK